MCLLSAPTDTESRRWSRLLASFCGNRQILLNRFQSKSTRDCLLCSSIHRLHVRHKCLEEQDYVRSFCDEWRCFSFILAFDIICVVKVGDRLLSSSYWCHWCLCDKYTKLHTHTYICKHKILCWDKFKWQNNTKHILSFCVWVKTGRLCVCVYVCVIHILRRI